jgi:hypothetical protein
MSTRSVLGLDTAASCLGGLLDRRRDGGYSTGVNPAVE